ncbi:MAG TPA: VWA domain-containing protein, partial [Bacteroidia bacterium]|nr:VWA domain-containing protein [Bacteroidia bacterium]
MIRFAHPEYLYALGLIPIVLILFIWMSAWKRKAIRRFGDQAMMKELRGNSSSAKPVLKLVFLLLALSMFVLAWANPQMGTRLEEVKREGVDIIIALDVSNSMRAEDIKPNRLERAKQAISRLIDKLENDRIGLIV